VNGGSLTRILVTAAVCTIALGADAVTPYKVTDVGALVDASTEAYGVNDVGQVVGALFLEDWMGGTHSYAVFWEGGMPYALWPPDERECVATDINNAGLIVGSVYLPDGSLEACLWGSGGLTTLGKLGGVRSDALGVNDAGQIIGLWSTTDTDLAFIWQDGVMTSLGTMEGGTFSIALDINSAGQVVGYGNYSAPFPFAGFLWEAGVMTPLEGLLAAHAINDLGQVVGYAKADDGEQHAALWEGGTVTDLGTLVEGGWSTPWDINGRGQVVGSAEAPEGSAQRAFVWEGGVMYDLNDLAINASAWTLARAYAVNEHGEIVGYGFVDGEKHAFLLTPIPEPSLPGLVAIAALALMISRRRSGHEQARCPCC